MDVFDHSLSIDLHCANNIGMLRCTLVVGIAEFGCFGLGCDSGFDCSTKLPFRCVHQQAGQLSVKIYHP